MIAIFLPAWYNKNIALIRIKTDNIVHKSTIDFIYQKNINQNKEDTL